MKFFTILTTISFSLAGLFGLDEFKISDLFTGNDSLSSDTVFELGEDIEANYEAEPCDLSGDRVSGAIVDIGFDSNYATRDYYARINDTGQLVEVIANEIILQDDDEESSYEEGDGRYCRDEAKVDGVEADDLDEGHVIADSLGGVSNSYNITPQDSQLNRYGTQADIENEIRDAGGATDFHATITYPDEETMTPSSYQISYKIGNKERTFDFENGE